MPSHFQQQFLRGLGSVWYVCLKLKIVVWKYFWKYVWVKKCVEMREMLFKNWKWLFKNTNQTPLKCFALFFLLLILEYDFDNIPPISFGQPLIEMNNRMKLPFNFNFCDFTFLLYKSPHGTKSHRGRSWVGSE